MHCASSFFVFYAKQKIDFNMALLISCDFNMFLALLILPQGIVIINAFWSNSPSANNFSKDINFRFESIIINIFPVLFSIG